MPLRRSVNVTIIVLHHELGNTEEYLLQLGDPERIIRMRIL
jgi:hypothetical protein